MTAATAQTDKPTRSERRRNPTTKEVRRRRRGSVADEDHRCRPLGSVAHHPGHWPPPATLMIDQVTFKTPLRVIKPTLCATGPIAQRNVASRHTNVCVCLRRPYARALGMARPQCHRTQSGDRSSSGEAPVGRRKCVARPQCHRTQSGDRSSSGEAPVGRRKCRGERPVRRCPWHSSE